MRDSDRGLSSIVNVIKVGLNDFDAEIAEALRPTLLACLHMSPELASHMEALERLTRSESEKLKVCLLETGDVEAFKEMFDIGGTPTFLVFQRGEEKGRLLGQADEDMLRGFVSRYVSNIE